MAQPTIEIYEWTAIPVTWFRKQRPEKDRILEARYQSLDLLHRDPCSI